MIPTIARRLSVALLILTTLAPSALAEENLGRHWTIEDILLVPKITDIALSQDGNTAIYAIEVADAEARRPRATIRLVDIASGVQRDLLHAESAKLIKPVPGSNDWSALLDVGAGLQLYRIQRSGKVSLVVNNPAAVLVGQADQALALGGGALPHRVGVLGYDWSPDGQWLWYSILKAKSNVPRVRFDGEVAALRNRRRSRIEAEVEFYLRGPSGEATKVMTRPSSDRIVTVAGRNVAWHGDEVQFRIDKRDGTAGGSYEIWGWDRNRKAMRTLASERDLQTIWILKGPRGGKLATSGTGEQLELTETLEDGRRYSYGHVAFTIGDPRSAGITSSPDGRRIAVGTRTMERPRYGLAIIDEHGLRKISGQNSLTQCGFNEYLTMAVCVQEGMSSPPALVRLDLDSGKIKRLVSVSTRHDEIAPLAVRPHTWINRNGYKATGYVIFPREYRAGERYPAIIVTHGSDADERFAAISNQWNYPVQLLAERGYMVVLVNDPWPQQAPELQAAYMTWLRGGGPAGPEEMQRLLWLNGAHSFEDATKDLVAEGLIDSARVGIAGYSRGSQMVNVTVMNSKLFRAASSGDGGFLEPEGYSSARHSYNAIFGGSPLSVHIDQYRHFAPSLNVDKTCTPVLQQVAAASPTQIALYEALRAEHVPTQITYYPGASAASDESHVFQIPGNRLLAMRENIAWFDYWLLGSRDLDAPFPERVMEWDRMANGRQPRCTTVAAH